MNASAGLGRVGAALVRVVAIASGALVLAAVLSDGIDLRIGSWTYEYRSLDGPLVVLAAVGLLALVLRLPRVVTMLRELADDAPPDRARRVAGVLVAALLAIGFVLRIARVGEYGLSMDEAQFVWVASADSLWNVCRYVFAESPHPPGHFVLLHALLGVSRDLLWLRLPSVVAGTFLVWISYRFTRELFGRAAGVAMAMLVTFSPALIDLSQVCRNYVPGLALLVLALWFFVRFLEHGRWRDFGVFAAAEVLACLWAYAFVIAFAATNVTLAAVFIQRRAPLTAWLRATLFQLPVVGMVGALYVEHIAKLPPTIVGFHEALYRGRLGVESAASFRPLLEAFEYLTPEGWGVASCCLAAIGLLVLLVTREWRPALLCVSPIALGYAAMVAGRLPLGATRHSVYLFPFLFALIARTGRDLLRWRSRRAAVLGVLLTITGLTAYAVCGVREYARDVEFVPFAGRHRELLTYYRQEDVDRAFEILAQRATPQDMVMITIQGLWTLRVQLGLVPRLDPTPAQVMSRDVRWPFAPPGPARYTHGRVSFYMSPDVGFMFTPELLVRAVRSLRAYYNLPEPPRVWALRTGWEPPLTRYFKVRYWGVSVDDDVDRESHGLLFAIDGATIGKLQAN